ncbi:MAG: aldose epimerase family protein [Bacteroidota bacterium]
MPKISAQRIPLRQVDNAFLYTLTNIHGHTVAVTNIGCAIQSIKVPDRDGALGEVVLGYNDIQKYLDNPVYFGTIVGRYANRIAGAQFSLAGTTYRLPANNGRNCLHGGPNAFEKQLWAVDSQDTHEESASISFQYTDPDGKNGFPGNLHVICRYTWTNKSELIIDYEATADQTTIVNLTNHSYFNLVGKGDILQYLLWLNADHYTPLDDAQIPTGELRSVRNTPFDFLHPKAIGSDIHQVGGYDHNWVLRKIESPQVPFAASIYAPQSGRELKCFTTQPGLQVFTTNFKDGEFSEREGRPVVRYQAICLEAQSFPDSPNQPGFPSTVLAPEEAYRETTIYQFSVR